MHIDKIKKGLLIILCLEMTKIAEIFMFPAIQLVISGLGGEGELWGGTFSFSVSLQGA
jgi:hypothetical protein